MARNWYSDLEQNPYNKLHRKFDGIAMIDVDSVEVCPHCTEPLAFIEHAKDVGQKFKAYKLTKLIADKFEVPGFLVFYTLNESNKIIKLRIKRISPSVGMTRNNVKPKEWFKYLKELQDEHGCEKGLATIAQNFSYGGTI